MATSFQLQIFPMEEQQPNEDLWFPQYQNLWFSQYQSSVPVPPCCDSFNIKLQYFNSHPSNRVSVEDQFMFPRDLFCDMGVNLLVDTFSLMHIPPELLYQVAPHVVSFARNMHADDNYKGRRTLNISVRIYVNTPSAPNGDDDSCRSWGGFINSLKKVRVGDDDASCCSICLDKLCDPTSEVVGTPCSHVFHRDCILRWLKNHSSCPMCRFQVRR
ncbi:hypothetical protein L6164_029065 [Bauhinia variegata]|uniref:Uncharacterized protein n=1 Tax=Bauhinia variegata TaxID=167791 RepID=A0ACB9L8I9_BAUVA|nr:hypothetical protein L6164_029065 [Bauhinia variegata]